VFGHDVTQPFLGRSMGSEPDYSDDVAREIDDEIRRIVESAHQSARDILSEHREDLDRVSNILLERETIDAKEFVALLDGASEEEVFGSDDEESGAPATPEAPEAEAEKSASREGPRTSPRPRPAYGGGSAEMRSDS
jgi:cell division protease FtsH